MSGIMLKEVDPADLSPPPAGKHTLFSDSTNGGIPSWMNYLGAITDLVGPQGAQGHQGNQGFQGNQGNQGFQGNQGTQGTQGVQGSQGNQGSTGAQGSQGDTGAQGPQGDTGAQGNQGAQGPQGVQGDAGLSGLTSPKIPYATSATTVADSDLRWDVANSRVGLATSSPVSAFSNTATVITASDGGNNATSGIVWVANTAGYALAIFNSSASTSAVLSCKSALSNSCIADFSQNATQNGTGTCVFRINGDGKVGVGLTSPYSMFANTATQIVASNAAGTIASSSLTWVANGSGFVAGFYNSNNSAASNCLAVKVANSAATTIALDISQGTSQNGTGTQLFSVYGDGKVSIGAGTPSKLLHMVGNSTTEIAGIIRNSNSGTTAYTGWFVTNNTVGLTDYIWLYKTSTGYTTNGLYTQASGGLQNTTGALVISNVAASQDIVFAVGGMASGNEAMRIDSNQNVSLGNAALATNATNGFLYIPTSAGAPSGTPTSKTGRVPLEYDTTNNSLKVYSSSWRDVITSTAVNSVSPTSPDRTITVNLGGTTYYIHAKTTND